MVFLDIFMGLFFVYVLLSLFASILQELISSLFSLRGKILVSALARFLGFESPKERFVFRMFLKTVIPSYKKLMSTNLLIKRYPSYLSKEQFIAIIQDLEKAEDQIEKITKNEGSKVKVGQLLNENKRLFDPFDYALAKDKFSDLSKKKDPNSLEPQVSNKYFFIRGINYDFFEKRLGRFFRRAVRNEALVVDNLNWFLNKIENFKLENEAIENYTKIVQAEFKPSISSSTFETEKAKNVLYKSYEDYMGRARGWYKRKVQLNLILLGFLIAFISNADTLAIFNHLSTNTAARENSVKLAESFAQSDQFQSYLKKIEVNYSDPKTKVDSLNALMLDLVKNEINPAAKDLGIGWDEELLKNSYNDEKEFSTFRFIGNAWCEMWSNSNKIFGFLLTALAISLGANFWFDLLVLLINIRNTGKRPSLGNNNSEEVDTQSQSINTKESSNPNKKIVG